MGAKATFNSVTRIIKLTEAPTLVNGEYVVSINVKRDLYGDQKEDWLSTPALRKVRPPISVIGGQTTPTGFAGNTFFLANDWVVELYDADQILTVDGNFYKSDGTSPFIKPSGGAYATQIDRFVSNIVDTVSVGSELATTQSNQLNDLWQFKGCDAANPAIRGGDGVTSETLSVDGKVLTITEDSLTRT